MPDIEVKKLSIRVGYRFFQVSSFLQVSLLFGRACNREDKCGSVYHIHAELGESSVAMEETTMVTDSMAVL